MKDLMKVMKRNNINFSYVPVEKLNRLTPNNHQGVVASISPISFYDLETLIETVIENGKKPLFLIFTVREESTFSTGVEMIGATAPQPRRSIENNAKLNINLLLIFIYSLIKNILTSIGFI